MSKPHKHAAVIKAWADGAIIQWRPLKDDPWRDNEPHKNLAWNTDYEYRVAPVKKPYRLWQDGFGKGHVIFDKPLEEIVKTLEDFEGWLTPWLEYEQLS